MILLNRPFPKKYHTQVRHLKNPLQPLQENPLQRDTKHPAIHPSSSMFHKQDNQTECLLVPSSHHPPIWLKRKGFPIRTHTTIYCNNNNPQRYSLRSNQWLQPCNRHTEGFWGCFSWLILSGKSRCLSEVSCGIDLLVITVGSLYLPPYYMDITIDDVWWW